MEYTNGQKAGSNIRLSDKQNNIHRETVEERLECINSKKLQFVKIRCQCGYTNLVPVYEVFHVYENVKCKKCGKVIAEPKAHTSYGL